RPTTSTLFPYTTLFRSARPALVAHSHPRYEGRSGEAADRQGDRTGGGREKNRILAAAHDALRTGWHLYERDRIGRRRRPRRDFRSEEHTSELQSRFDLV